MNGFFAEHNETDAGFYIHLYEELRRRHNSAYGFNKVDITALQLSAI
jgi:hypothetical protein